MYLHKTAFLSAFLTAAALLLFGATYAFAETYQTNLSGSNEVPAVASSTTGTASVRFDDNGSNMTYTLSVWNGDEITAAHLHCGDAGENGPAVVTLYSDSNGTDVHGLLASSTIGNQHIHDVDCTNTIGYDIADVGDLSEAIENGDIYVNVHSQAHPDGVARGQLPSGNGNNNSDDTDGYHGNDGHGWKDDDHDGKDDWYQDGHGSWKDSCQDWTDENNDGSHDWNHKDKNEWTKGRDNQWDDDKDQDDQSWNNSYDWKHDDRGWNDDSDTKDWNDDRDQKEWKTNDDYSWNGKDGNDGRDGKDGKESNWNEEDDDSHDYSYDQKRSERSGIRSEVRLKVGLGR